MTTKDAFTEPEWTAILEGLTSAAMAVITASPGGMFRETYAEAKFLAEARRQSGHSELLDAIVAHKPVTDHSVKHSNAEMVDAAKSHLTDAVTAIKSKATPEELADYQQFVTKLCETVAKAHREGNDDVNAQESAVLADVAWALGVRAG
jgi:hypothetical protein